MSSSHPAAAASEFTEIEIEVAADLVRSCPGLSLDVGGSVAKIVYRSKKDWKELVNNKDAKTGKLRLLSCARTLLDEAIAKVKEEAHITRLGDHPTEIFTCGIGCSQFGARINRQLGIKLSNVMEMDCFIKSFVYLAERYSPQTLLKPPMKEAEDEANKFNAEMLEAMTKFNEMSSLNLTISEDNKTTKSNDDIMKSDKPMVTAINDFYPSMLAMLGSAFAFMSIKADGSFSIPDGSNRGGRTLLGLGCLLTGAKTYNEIIDLAEKGERFKVDMSNLALGKETPVEGEDQGTGTDVYGDLFQSEEGGQEQIIFAFGHAVGKNLADFKREDLAAAIVHTSIMDTVQTIHMTAVSAGTKHVFISGSYAARDFVRKLFIKEWIMRSFSMTMLSGRPAEEMPKLYFLRAGSHLGALGALINNTEGFIAKDGKVANKSEDNSNNSNAHVEANVIDLNDDNGPTKL